MTDQHDAKHTPSETKGFGIPDPELMAHLIAIADGAVPFVGTHTGGGSPNVLDHVTVAKALDRKTSNVARALDRAAEAGLITLEPFTVTPRARALMLASASPEAVLSGGAGQGAGAPRGVLLRQLRPDPENPRKHFDHEELVALANNIARDSLRTPIEVRAMPSDAGETTTEDGLPLYMIVAGERRWRALNIIAASFDELQAEAARLGETVTLDDAWLQGAAVSAQDPHTYPVPVTILDFGSGEGEDHAREAAMDKLLLALAENMMREEMNYLEEGVAFLRLQDDFAMKPSAIADYFGGKRTPRYVQQRIQIARAFTADSDEARRNYRDAMTGAIAFTAAREMVQDHAPPAPKSEPAASADTATPGAPAGDDEDEGDEDFDENADEDGDDAAPSDRAKRETVAQRQMRERDEAHRREQRTDEARARTLLPATVEELAARYMNAVRVYDAAIAESDLTAAALAERWMELVQLAANDGEHLGCAVSEGWAAIQRTIAAPVGIVPLYGQPGRFVAETDGVRAIVDLREGSLHAVDPLAAFPSCSGFLSVFPGGYVATGKTPMEAGRDLVRAGIDYARSKDGGGLVMPGAVYRIDPAGNDGGRRGGGLTRLRRGAAVVADQTVAGVEIAPAAAMLDEWRAADAASTSPRKKTGFPKPRSYGVRIVSQQQDGSWKPVADFPVSGAYLFQDQSTKADEFWFVQDGAHPVDDGSAAFTAPEDFDDQRRIEITLPPLPEVASAPAASAITADAIRDPLANITSANAVRAADARAREDFALDPHEPDSGPSLPLPEPSALPGSPGTLLDRLFLKIAEGQASLLIQGDEEAHDIARRLYERGGAHLPAVAVKASGQSIRFDRTAPVATAPAPDDEASDGDPRTLSLLDAVAEDYFPVADADPDQAAHLERLGFIKRDGDCWAITEAGETFLASGEPLPDPAPAAPAPRRAAAIAARL